VIAVPAPSAACRKTARHFCLERNHTADLVHELFTLFASAVTTQQCQPPPSNCQMRKAGLSQCGSFDNDIGSRSALPHPIQQMSADQQPHNTQLTWRSAGGITAMQFQRAKWHVRRCPSCGPLFPTEAVVVSELIRRKQTSQKKNEHKKRSTDEQDLAHPA